MHPCPKIITDFTKKVMRSFMVESGLEPALFGNRFQIQDATLGQVNFSLLIHYDNLNRLKILHGGAIASLVDLGGSLAVASTGRWVTGVSTDINVSYLKAGGMEGDTLQGLALCDKIGKSLAYTTVSLRNGGGDLVARGSHTKYVLIPESQELWVVPPSWEKILQNEAKSSDGSRASGQTETRTEGMSQTTPRHTSTAATPGLSGLARPKLAGADWSTPGHVQSRGYHQPPGPPRNRFRRPGTNQDLQEGYPPNGCSNQELLGPDTHERLQNTLEDEVKQLVGAMAPSAETNRLRMRYGLPIKGKSNTTQTAAVEKLWASRGEQESSSPENQQWKNMWLKDMANNTVPPGKNGRFSRPPDAAGMTNINFTIRGPKSWGASKPAEEEAEPPMWRGERRPQTITATAPAEIPAEKLVQMARSRYWGPGHNLIAPQVRNEIIKALPRLSPSRRRRSQARLEKWIKTITDENPDSVFVKKGDYEERKEKKKEEPPPIWDRKPNPFGWRKTAAAPGWVDILQQENPWEALNPPPPQTPLRSSRPARKLSSLPKLDSPPTRTLNPPPRWTPNSPPTWLRQDGTRRDNKPLPAFWSTQQAPPSTDNGDDDDGDYDNDIEADNAMLRRIYQEQQEASSTPDSARRDGMLQQLQNSLSTPANTLQNTDDDEDDDAIEGDIMMQLMRKQPEPQKQADTRQNTKNQDEDGGCDNDVGEGNIMARLMQQQQQQKLQQQQEQDDELLLNPPLKSDNIRRKAKRPHQLKLVKARPPPKSPYDEEYDNDIEADNAMLHIMQLQQQQQKDSSLPDPDIAQDDELQLQQDPLSGLDPKADNAVFRTMTGQDRQWKKKTGKEGAPRNDCQKGEILIRDLYLNGKSLDKRFPYCEHYRARYGEKRWDAQGARQIYRESKPTLPHQLWLEEYGPKSDW